MTEDVQLLARDEQARRLAEALERRLGTNRKDTLPEIRAALRRPLESACVRFDDDRAVRPPRMETGR
jgi:hypothetical protein